MQKKKKVFAFQYDYDRDAKQRKFPTAMKQFPSKDRLVICKI